MRGYEPLTGRDDEAVENRYESPCGVMSAFVNVTPSNACKVTNPHAGL